MSSHAAHKGVPKYTRDQCIALMVAWIREHGVPTHRTQWARAKSGHPHHGALRRVFGSVRPFAALKTAAQAALATEVRDCQTLGDQLLDAVLAERRKPVTRRGRQNNEGA